MHRIQPRQSEALHLVASIQALERAAAAGLPPHTLMQRAGLAVARLALAQTPHAHTIWVACGPGNNGGDGLEAAMHLRRRGKTVVVTWLGDQTKASADTAASWANAVAAGVGFAPVPPAEFDLCIDALLGIGTARAPEGTMREWIGHMLASGKPVLAVDVPSGLMSDTGALAPAVGAKAPDAVIPAKAGIQGAPTLDSRFRGNDEVVGGRPDVGANDKAMAVKATWTLSLLALKPGLFTAQGRDHAGEVWFDDLGVTPGAPDAQLGGQDRSPQALRQHASHKGSYGDVAVLGGASGMTGAALLAASAALHAGAGRTFVALLDPAAIAVDTSQPELMFRRPDKLDLRSLTVVCGCGGGDAVHDALPRVLSLSARLVLDADALNAIASDTSLQNLLQARAARGLPTVLTPHPLEAARLLGCDAAAVQHDRLASVRALTARFACVVVLKGSGTVIAGPGEVPLINPSGNARLATAGTGDVLAGWIGARLAGGLPAFQAACAGALAHGLTADAWPAGRPLTAGTLARAALP